MNRTRVGQGNRPEQTHGLNLDCAWNGFDLSARKLLETLCSMYH
ncbi:hypothetical protein NXW00_28425 [Bacteroides thetaiotaomicron]|nr:hypothetical protein [Bacteroides thetaiotaomicron]